METTDEVRVHCGQCDQWVECSGPWCTLYVGHRLCVGRRRTLAIGLFIATSPAQSGCNCSCQGSHYCQLCPEHGAIVQWIRGENV